MFLKMSTAAAALIAATAIAGAASAQGQSNAAPGAAQTDTGSAAAPTSAQNGPGPDAASAPAPATDTSGYNVGAPQTDPNTGAQIVTNGPVPDTHANRARFGTPDSHAGKRTSPAGN